jgi:hypothetical protein
MPQYKLIYEPYKLSELITKARSDKEGGTFGEAETKQWNDALNREAKVGWKVKNSGVIQSSEEDIIFWALMEAEN